MRLGYYGRKRRGHGIENKSNWSLCERGYDRNHRIVGKNELKGRVIEDWFLGRMDKIFAISNRTFEWETNCGWTIWKPRFCNGD